MIIDQHATGESCTDPSLEIYNGNVVRIEQYGLFVEVNDVPGLLRIPELSWDWISHPSEVADIGDEITFLVFNLNAPEKRPHEQFNGSIKILDTRLHPTQDTSGLVPLPLIQLLQTLRDDFEYQGFASPTIFVSENSHTPSDMPLLLADLR